MATTGSMVGSTGPGIKNLAGQRYARVVRLSPSPRILAALALSCALVAESGCGVAPVRRDGSVAPPPTWTYVGHHGRPLAFGGNVCEVAGVHKHQYPPSPRDAFTTTTAGLVDNRRTWPFYGNHRHGGRTCFREGWHLHLEPPDETLQWDDVHAGWRTP